MRLIKDNDVTYQNDEFIISIYKNSGWVEDTKKVELPKKEEKVETPAETEKVEVKKSKKNKK